MGVIQAQAEKLSNEELKIFKVDNNLDGENWERVKSHVVLSRKLKRMK